MMNDSAKMIFDIVFSLCLIILLSPVFAVLAILIAYNLGYPVFLCKIELEKMERYLK